SSLLYFFFFYSRPDIPTLPSFPTRRSSDLRLSSCGGRTGPRMTVSPFLVQTADFVSPAISKEVFSGYSRDRDERTPESSPSFVRSEEHTSELQSRGHLVCRLLLEKKKTQQT